MEYIRHVLTLSEINATEINDYVAHLTYTTALFVCRLSGLAFFHRLCVRHEALIRTIYASVAFLVCAFIPQFLLILLHCKPITGLWPYPWQPEYGHYTCLSWVCTLLGGVMESVNLEIRALST